MGNQAAKQQNQPVYYDAELGQYYTVTPKNNSKFAGMFGNQLPISAYSSNPLLAAFASSGIRTYLNGFNQNRMPNYGEIQTPVVPTIQDLFPLMNNSAIMNSAMSQPTQSSGAGRFISLLGDSQGTASK